MTGGLKVPKHIDLEGPLKWDSTRRNMTALDRKYRERYLRDQRLAAHEPDLAAYLRLSNMHKNFIRRSYGWPADQVFKRFIPLVGYYRAGQMRYLIPRFFWFGMVPAFTICYYFKYIAWEDWEVFGGWRMLRRKPTLLPLDEGFGVQELDAEFKSEYSNDGNFLQRKIFVDIDRDNPPTSTPLSKDNVYHPPK